MSRTYRDTKYAGFFRHPKTQGYRRDLIGAEEEIKTELGSNYLGGNFAEVNTIPTAYYDLLVQGKYEDIGLSHRLELIFEEKILEDKLNKKSAYGTQFDSRKNCFRVYRTYKYKRTSLVDYLPFIVTIKNKQYPVKLKIEWWYA